MRGRGLPGCAGGGDGAGLDEAEAEFLPGWEDEGVFVKAGGEADRTWEADAEHFAGETWIRAGMPREPGEAAESGDGEVMDALGIEAEERGAEKGFVEGAAGHWAGRSLRLLARPAAKLGLSGFATTRRSEGMTTKSMSSMGTAPRRTSSPSTTAPA